MPAAEEVKGPSPKPTANSSSDAESKITNGTVNAAFTEKKVDKKAETLGNSDTKDETSVDMKNGSAEDKNGNTEKNDSAGGTLHYNPGSREIVGVVLDLWKQRPDLMDNSYAKLLAIVKDFKADSGWALSEKRMKAALKEFNIQPNQPKRTFVKETTSSIVSNRKLPPGTTIQMAKGRSKTMFATRAYREGKPIWEETPLMPTSNINMLRLMRKGLACAYCAKLIATTPDGKPMPRGGVACINCTVNWCSNSCKRLDLGHTDEYHDSRATMAKLSGQYWRLYEQRCIENDLNACYMAGIYFIHKIKTGPGSDFNTIMGGMARVRQDTKAKSVFGDATLQFEQYEELLKKVYSLLAKALKPIYNLTYDEYVEAVGMVNINNLENCIFEVYANLNHSCEPNIKPKFKSDSRADGITVVAKRDIEPGDELTTTYVNPALGLDDRQTALRVNWGFTCACPRCEREEYARANPVKIPKPALKKSSGNNSPTDETRARSKSVHFDEKPEILPSPTPH